MELRTLPRSTIQVSRIGLGTVQFGLDYGYTKAFAQRQVDPILDRCAELGMNLLDTARGYGDSESKIGDYRKRHTDARFVLCTKLDKISQDVSADESRLREEIGRSIRCSLDALAADRVEMLMIHQTDAFLIGNPRFWSALAAVREQGMFDRFGVSVYEVGEAEALLDFQRAHVNFLQLPYNAFDRRFLPLLLKCGRAGVGTMIRSVFLKGVLTAPPEDIPPRLEGILPYKKDFDAAARKHGLSSQQLALAFVLGTKSVDTSILGVASVEELEENAGVFDHLQSAPSIINDLSALDAPDRALSDPRRWPATHFPEDKDEASS